MENLKQEVLKGFEINPKSIIKSKHSYICKTGGKAKVIQKTQASENALMCADKLKKELEKNGYPVYDKFYTSTQNLPYFVLDGERYTMTDFKDYAESDFSNGDDVKKIIRTTALFHRISKTINIETETKSNILNIYEKQLANFKTVKKNISFKKKGSYSEFDVLFIKNYDYFLKKASNAMSLLKELFKNPESSKNFELLCHNNIKEETAVKYNGTMSLISFENVSKGLFISDFSDIINRYVRKHTPPALNFENILEAYFKINPLSDTEIKILQAILKFPSKYMKICCNFYSKSMSFVPNSIINHLNCIISQKNIYENYTKYI